MLTQDNKHLDWQARDGKSDLYQLLRTFDARQGGRGDERERGTCAWEQAVPVQAPVRDSDEVWREEGAGEGREESQQGPLLQTDGRETQSRGEARASSSLSATTSPLNFIL